MNLQLESLWFFKYLYETVYLAINFLQHIYYFDQNWFDAEM